MDAKAHWEHVYGVRESKDFSWYQAVPTASLALLDRVPISPNT